MAIRAGPAILREKQEKARENREKKDLEKAEEKRRLWEEKAKKKSIDGADDEAVAPAAAPATTAA